MVSGDHPPAVNGEPNTAIAASPVNGAETKTLDSEITQSSICVETNGETGVRESNEAKPVHHFAYFSGSPATIFTVSKLTRTTCPTRRTMYSGSSARFGSDLIPLRLSSLTWYWSITHSRAERLPRRYWKTSGGIPASF